MFIDSELALRAHFTILIHHTVDTPLFHCLGVVDMLRRKLPILTENQFHAEKSHSYSNY